MPSTLATLAQVQAFLSDHGGYQASDDTLNLAIDVADADIQTRLGSAHSTDTSSADFATRKNALLRLVDLDVRRQTLALQTEQGGGSTLTYTDYQKERQAILNSIGRPVRYF